MATEGDGVDSEFIIGSTYKLPVKKNSASDGIRKGDKSPLL